MTTTADDTVVLSFEERFTVALMRSGMTKREFAEYAGTTPKTLWRYATLRDAPNVGILRLLALASGLAFEWLRPSPDEVAESREKYAPWDLNPEPTDSEPLVVIQSLAAEVLAEAEAIVREAVAA